MALLCCAFIALQSERLQIGQSVLNNKTHDTAVILYVDHLCIHLWITLPVAATQSLPYPAEFSRQELKRKIDGSYASMMSPSESDSLNRREAQDGIIGACTLYQESIWHLAQPPARQSRTAMGTAFDQFIYIHDSQHHAKLTFRYQWTSTNLFP
jgi:hypothetical protein